MAKPVVATEGATASEGSRLGTIVAIVAAVAVVIAVVAVVVLRRRSRSLEE